ncbi:MAG: phosphatidylglycerophosphatase A [Gammaproteobacteria bacterium]|nr:phosphatidylglycerophosphatase A [Gammaproteobacteria bacterium]MCF6260886.1 phosphatidylglycerophosphatase A [Gammaproteobacteria bacterium]
MSKNSAPRSVWRNPIHFLAFGFGSGAMPFAPGTFGTLAALPIYLLMVPLSLWAYLAVVVVMTLLGVWLCHVTSRDLGVHDHGGIVWDEIVGYLITMIAAPPGWQWMVAGFVLFRFFDIIKPWPIGWADRRVHGGLGIMLDDVLAAVLAWVVLQGVAFILVY